MFRRFSRSRENSQQDAGYKAGTKDQPIEVDDDSSMPQPPPQPQPPQQAAYEDFMTDESTHEFNPEDYIFSDDEEDFENQYFSAVPNPFAPTGTSSSSSSSAPPPAPASVSTLRRRPNDAILIEDVTEVFHLLIHLHQQAMSSEFSVDVQEPEDRDWNRVFSSRSPSPPPQPQRRSFFNQPPPSMMPLDPFSSSSSSFGSFGRSRSGFGGGGLFETMNSFFDGFFDSMEMPRPLPPFGRQQQRQQRQQQPFGHGYVYQDDPPQQQNSRKQWNWDSNSFH